MSVEIAMTQRESIDCSAKAEEGDEVSVHYTGFLADGSVFDSSIQQKRDPITFQLGKGMVIKGWDEGIKGMCVGEQRKLEIPPHLAYGKKGHPPVIPPQATLTFETELVAVRKVTMDSNILKGLQLLSIPCVTVYVVYYLYKKYKKETATTSHKGSKSKDNMRKKRR